MSPPRSPLRPRRALALLLAGALAALGLLEVAWRGYLAFLASPAERLRYLPLEEIPPESLRVRPHPYLGYVLNEDYRDPTGRNRHSSLGLRGAEIERAKPPGTFRIACLGGSTTYTEFVPDWRAAWPQLLEDELRARSGHDRIEVLNAGVPGYTSWESMLNLQLRILDLDPDLVIVHHGTNDVHPRLVPPPTYRRDNSGYRKAWSQEEPWWDELYFLRYLGVRLGFSPSNDLGHLVRVIPHQPQGPAERLDANPPVHFERNLRTMVVLCRDLGVEVLLTTWAHCPDKGDYAASPVYRQGFRECNELVLSRAAAWDVPCYDFAAEMPRDPSLWHDGRHVNEEGARRKARLFADFVQARFLGR